MQTYPISILGIVFLAMAALARPSAAAVDYQTLNYTGEPLRLHLVPGEQSILIFPWRVHYGTSAKALGAMEIQPIGDTLYITPMTDTVGEVLYWFKNPATGAMIQAYVRVDENGAPLHARVQDVRNGPPGAPTALTGGEEHAPRGQGPRAQAGAPTSEEAIEHGAATLVRFAMQEIYAPERLRQPLQGVNLVRLTDPSGVDWLFVGAEILARPWAEWKTSDGLYVTVLELTNLESRPVGLDPRRIRYSPLLDWAAMLDTSLEPNGSLFSSTALVLLSRGSWRETLDSYGRALARVERESEAR